MRYRWVQMRYMKGVRLLATGGPLDMGERRKLGVDSCHAHLHVHMHMHMRMRMCMHVCMPHELGTHFAA